MEDSDVGYTRIASDPDGESWLEEGGFVDNNLEQGKFEAGLILTRSAVFAFRFSVVISNINPDHVLTENYLNQLPPEVRRHITSSLMYLKEDM